MKLWAVIAGLWLALIAPALAQDHPLKGVALVIGESKYDGLLPALSNPRNDARAMDDLLSDLGFDVTRVLDGDKRKLDSEIADFEDSAKDADVALVYYSGHGIEAGGEDYLVPVDADLSTPQAAGAGLVPVDAMLDRLGHTVPVTIVLLDACRTNGLPAGTLIQPPGSSGPLVATDAGLAIVRGPTTLPFRPGSDQLGTVIGFAASPGQSALDGAPSDANSPYAAALLKHLGAGGYSFGDLMTMVSEEVYLKTGARQLPWVNSSLRRVLTFGTPLPAGDADDAAIADGRRQLLLSIARTPEATRGTVESIAEAEGVPLDALYGMLQQLGVDTSSPDTLQQKLQAGAQQLKQFMEQRPGAAKSDPELQRLSSLADRAQQEGAMGLALKYREAASLRAKQLEAQVDANEASVKADRLQLATTYGDNADTAMLNFDYEGAVQRYQQAYDQAKNWDAAAAKYYQRGQADAMAALSYERADPQMQAQAIDLYGALIEATDRSTDPLEWGQLHNNRGGARERIGSISADLPMFEAASDDFTAALTVFTREAYPSEWAVATANLAAMDDLIGQATNDIARQRRGVELLRAMLATTSRINAPDVWARMQFNIGSALDKIGRVADDKEALAQSVVALQAAAEVWKGSPHVMEFAMVQNALGDNLIAQDRAADAVPILEASLATDLTDPVKLQALLTLGQAQQRLAGKAKDGAAWDPAIAAYRRAMSVPDDTKMAHAKAQTGLAYALLMQATTTLDVAALHEAIGDLDAALRVRTPDGVIGDWAESTVDLGMAQIELAIIEKSRAGLEDARQTFTAGQAVLKARGLPPNDGMSSGLTLIDKFEPMLPASSP